MSNLTVGDAAIAVVRRNTEEVQGKGNWDSPRPTRTCASRSREGKPDQLITTPCWARRQGRGKPSIPLVPPLIVYVEALWHD